MHGDAVLDFFTQDECFAKYNYAWSDWGNTIHNPLSKGLAELEEANIDCNFVVDMEGKWNEARGYP